MTTKTCSTLLALKTWEAKLAQGQLDPILRDLACLAPDQDIQPARQRLAKLLATYRREFDPTGQRQVAIFSAPGRTELLGNHTDHQGGKILAAAVNRDILAVAGFNQESNPPQIRLASQGWPLSAILLDNLHPQGPESGNSRGLVRGIAAGLAKLAWEGNLKGLSQFPLYSAWADNKPRGPKALCPELQLQGLDIATESQVKTGSGISSSAAFEVCLAKLMATLWGWPQLDPLALAQVGQYAENIYFGKPSGLMDQLASAEGGAVYVDFSTPSPQVEKHAFPLTQAGYQLVLMDSKSDHAKLSGEYAAITAEMGKVAQALGQDILSQVAPEDFFASLPSLHKQVSDRALLRALHYYTECQRVDQAKAALDQGDIDTYLALVKASGRSSYMYLQNIYPSGAVQAQDMGLALALAEHSLAGRGACRVHGGGFGGTIQALVPYALYPRFKQEMEEVFGQGTCHALAIRDLGAVCLDPAHV